MYSVKKEKGYFRYNSNTTSRRFSLRKKSFLHEILKSIKTET